MKNQPMTTDALDQGKESAPKAKVFISYSRKDIEFANRLDATLKERGFEPLIDRTDIYAFEEWWKRVEDLIVRADTVVFVLSPDAVRPGSVALREVAFAASLNKRFAPIVFRQVEDKDVPETLAKLNFIFFVDPARFERNADELAEALKTDIGWIRRHTEFGEQAQRWALAKSASGLLLRSPLLEEAERWVASRPENAPPPTEETRAFIAQSRQTATRRRNVLTASLAVGLVLALGLAGLAYWQRGVAVEQERIAEHQRRSAEEQRAAAIEQRDKALLTQSRFLADLANQRTREGSPVAAMLLAIEALPNTSSVERPYVPEAEAALYAANLQDHEIFVLAGDPYRRSGNELEAPRWARAVYSRDGQRIATATDGNTARIWDAATGKLVATLSGHGKSTNKDILPAYINDIAFSPDGARVVTASDDETARIWDSTTGKTGAILSGHAGWVESAAFSPDGQRVVTASDDKTARIWNAETGDSMFVLQGHADYVETAAFSQNGRRVVTASTDKTARIWDADTGRAIAVLAGHKGIVWSAVFSPDGRRIVTASTDKTARIWDADTGKPVSVLAGHEDGINTAVFSPDGRRIVTASDDKTARVWDSGTGKTIAVLSGHTDRVRWAAFSPDGRQVVTVSVGSPPGFGKDYTARVWDVESGAAIAVLTGHTNDVVTATFSPDGTRVVTASMDLTARVWVATPRYGSRVLSGHSAAVSDVTFSSDGKNVLTVSADKTGRVWDFETGALVAVLSGHRDSVESGTFSPDGRRVLTVSKDKMARIWDLTTGKTAAILSDTDNEILQAMFSPDGSRVLTISGKFDAKTASIWDARTGKWIPILPDNVDVIRKALFSPDGSRVLTISGKTSSIWDAQTGSRVSTLTDESLIRDGRFSPNGDRIATASSAAFIWDTASGKSVAVLDGHQDWVNSVAFSPDGLQVVTASSDATARIWDAQTGTVITVLEGHEGPVADARFSPDGRYVLTEAFHGRRIWDAANGETLATLPAPRVIPPNDVGYFLMLFSSKVRFSPDGKRIMMDRDNETQVLDTHSGKVIALLSGNAAKFSPNGRYAVTASDMTARIWHLFDSTQEQVEEGKRIVSRCLLPDEREKAFLEREPPQWCLEMEKWPYQKWQTWRTPHD